MVASTHYLGSAAGMAILERGGNAFDAAAAAGVVLQGGEPHLNGPGGGMSLLFAQAGRLVQVLCGQGPAPAAATVDAYCGLGLAEIPGSGLTAAAIPGSTLAWLMLLRDHGTIDVATVLDAAIGYAERGFPVLASIENSVISVAELFGTEWTSSAAQYLLGGRAPRAGERLANPALAATYRRLVEAAAGKAREAGIDAAIRAWREGFVADAIDAFCRMPAMDSTGDRHPGFVTGADLAAWLPRYEEPATVRFGDYTVAKTGPWGQGPVLLQQLSMLDGVDLEPDSAEFVHIVVEGAKLALADRNAFYGDSAEVPLATLLSAGYAAARRALIGQAASRELRAGSPDGRTPVFPSYAAAATYGSASSVRAHHPDDAARDAVCDPTQGEPTVPEARPAAAEALPEALHDALPDARGRTRGDTCHIDVVDRWGNMVSATPSGGWLQSSPLIPALGFPLGTRLQMMTLEPGLPTTLRPGRRPRTTLSPTMVSVGGDAVLACGTPGGDQQDQWQVPFLLRHLRERRNLQEAIDAPTFHTTHVPSSFAPHDAHPGQLVIEDRFDEAVLAELRSRGHEVVLSGPWSLGRLSAVSRDLDTGVLRAGANPRGMQGYAVGR